MGLSGASRTGWGAVRGQGACGNERRVGWLAGCAMPFPGTGASFRAGPLGSNKLLCWERCIKSTWGKPSEPVIGHQANQSHGFAVTTRDFLSRAPTVSSAN